MEGVAYWGTTNIKVASAVAAFGGHLRENDPITHMVREDGSRQVTFWFQAGAGENVRTEMESKWADMKSGQEAPIRYVRAALENRETLLGLVKRAEPIQVIKRGEQTLLVPLNAKPELKKAILKAI
jgi:predicted PhzF superfamily epimerase YddE/YHI9